MDGVKIDREAIIQKARKGNVDEINDLARNHGGIILFSLQRALFASRVEMPFFLPVTTTGTTTDSNVCYCS
jgi:hypothetical protein